MNVFYRFIHINLILDRVRHPTAVVYVSVYCVPNQVNWQRLFFCRRYDGALRSARPAQTQVLPSAKYPLFPLAALASPKWLMHVASFGHWKHADFAEGYFQDCLVKIDAAVGAVLLRCDFAPHLNNKVALLLIANRRDAIVN